MNIKQLLVILFGISLLSSVALADTYGKVVNTGSTSLKVRTGPGPQYNAKDRLQHGEIVRILGVHGPWYEIEYHKGLTGFSFGNDVKFRYIRPLEQPEHEGYVRVVTKAPLNVRNGPSYSDFQIIGKVAGNSILQTLSKVTYYKDVDGNTTSWFRVQDRNGEVGYVNGSRKYVKLLYKSNYELDAFNLSAHHTLSRSSLPENEDVYDEPEDDYEFDNKEESSKCDCTKNQDATEVHSNCHREANVSHSYCMKNTCKKLSRTLKERESCEYACERKRGASKEYCDRNYINSLN